MHHRITSGYYCLFRFLLGIYCIVHFTALIPYATEIFSNVGILSDRTLSPLYPFFPNPLFWIDSPIIVFSLLVGAIIGSIGLCLGRREGICALLIWWVATSLFDRNPLISNPSLPYLGWMLLAIAAIAYLRDPEKPWIFPKEIFRASWIVLALGYSYSGYTKLISPSWLDGSAIEEILLNPLSRNNGVVEWLIGPGAPLLPILTWSSLAIELLFAPLALSQRLRPWLWLSMIAMHLGLMGLIRFADLSLAMILFHCFTFDPGWIPGRRSQGALICFYDGNCGMCHGFVQFVAREGSQSCSVQFSAQSSDLFISIKPEVTPDSIACYRRDTGEWLFQSDAIAEILAALGGLWRLLGFLLRWIPKPLSTFIYNYVAIHRTRWFSKPSAQCPVLSKEWFATNSAPLTSQA